MIEKMTAIIKLDIFNIPLSELESLIKVRIVRLTQFAKIRAVQATQTNTRMATSEKFWTRLIADLVIARFRAF
jgi:hypothetical protein